MDRIFILTLLISVTDQKLSNTPYEEFDNHLYSLDYSQPHPSIRVDESHDGGDHLWVLEITDELKDLKLRPGDAEEDEDFEEVIGPLRKRLLAKARLPKTPAAPRSADDLRRALLQALNKQTISLHEDLEDDLNDLISSDESSTSITVYSKANLSVILLRCGKSARRYVLPPPPLAMPPLHTAQLYEGLLHVVTTFSYLPV